MAREKMTVIYNIYTQKPTPYWLDNKRLCIKIYWLYDDLYGDKGSANTRKKYSEKMWSGKKGHTFIHRLQYVVFISFFSF